ncbi:uncharacterized protein LOC103722640 [Phoenix dactylifera]|uniref:Uncharacterized protein LOC103722640 n=1 Tax=Phoenix dactylifera TaxID=42345 RepID=A0A8B9A835_PHODC|nr:uncharacterized protein LOC103722640 [Phoenix dactylifera]
MYIAARNRGAEIGKGDKRERPGAEKGETSDILLSCFPIPIQHSKILFQSPCSHHAIHSLFFLLLSSLHPSRISLSFSFSPVSILPSLSLPDDYMGAIMGARCRPASNSLSDDGGDGDREGVPVFGEFRLEELRAVTAGFGPHHIVSKHGEELSNVVCRGQLPHTDRVVAVKRLNKSAWPDPRQLLKEARFGGSSRASD